MPRINPAHVRKFRITAKVTPADAARFDKVAHKTGMHTRSDAFRAVLRAWMRVRLDTPQAAADIADIVSMDAARRTIQLTAYMPQSEVAQFDSLIAGLSWARSTSDAARIILLDWSKKQ